jgi:uncharacterized protein
VGRSILNAPLRYREVDALRGFALFGVLLVNLYSFGADSMAWDEPFNRAFWQIKHVFFESKFWGLFSLLFGISFWLQTRLALQPWRLLRRYGALLLFGCCHALLFEGDILMLYAEFGVLLLLMHKCPTRVLVVIATALLLTFPLAHYSMPERGFSDSASTVAEARQWLEEDREDGLYSTGSLDEIIAEHASYLPEIPWQDYQWPDSGWAVFALFLLGFCFAREGGLQRFTQRPERIFKAGCWMFLLGLSAMAIEGWMTQALGYRVFGDTASGGGTQLMGDLVFLFGTLLLTAAWFCLMHSFATRCSEWWLVRALETVGRMSLTTYLSQTLIFTTLFYGYGLGWAYWLGPAAVTGLAVAIFVVQMLLAKVWFNYFLVGPVEWLWRLATDLRPPALRAMPGQGLGP